MLRILLSISSLLAACTPSPQKAAMPSPSPVSDTIGQSSSNSAPEETGSATRGSSEQAVVYPGQPASEAIPKSVPLAKQAVPGPLTDSPAEADGRRILSTAFVRVGPDGHLTVELRDGNVVVLRDVAMRPKDYCGVRAADGADRARYCGGYAEIAAARPGGAPVPVQPDVAISKPAAPARSPAESK